MAGSEEVYGQKSSSRQSSRLVAESNMISVFLSASVPLPPPDRSARYFETADTIAIRDSIRALVTCVVPRGKLVFGGHPAITPMIRLLVRSMELPVRQHVVLFQSEFFKKEFPQESAEFEQVRLVKAVPGDRDESLARMREVMIRSEDFSAAVFIGGMEGVEEEYQIFKQWHPSKPLIPVASTGAAARLIFDRFHADDRELLSNSTYLSLFRRRLYA